MTYRHFYILVLFLFGIWTSNSYAQNNSEEVIKQANELFEQGKYVEATPLFNRLLSNDQRNHEWNYKYGTCLIYNAVNKGDAIKYLKFAVKGNVPAEANYYLGKAYHLDFQFNEAQKYYSRYKKEAGSKALKNLDVDRQIQMCKNGQQLLSTMNDLVIQSRKSIKEEDFFRLYDLSQIGGTILVTQDYQSKLDKKNNHVAVVHFDKDAQFIVYSSYGEEGDNLDLYMKRKLPDGTYSKPMKLEGSVNTNFDEGYGYMHPDGRKLYFSSKGHNSMGGYDVFEADYNPETNTFSNVKNLDFAISTPANDIFFVVDKDFQNCYFASDRQSKDGKIHVYKALVTRIPAQMAVIKGDFLNKINAGNKKAEITVQDYATGKDIGKFNTKEDGGYLIVLPKPGKYKYFVNADGSELTHVAVVEVPYLKEFRPLKQGMELITMDGHEQLIINNKFDELFDDPASILAEIYKQKAELDPNADQFDLDSLKKVGNMGKVLEELSLNKLSPRELGELAKRTLEDTKIELENADKKKNIAGNLVAKKLEDANEAYTKAEELLEAAKNEKDPNKKEDLIAQAGEQFDKANILQKEAKSALELVSKNEEIKDSLKNVITQGEQFTKAYQDALKNEDEDLKNKAISENLNYLTAVSVNQNDKNPNASDDGVSKAQDKYKENVKQLNDAEVKINALENEIAEISQTIKTTKKKKDIEALEKEIENKQNEIAEIKEMVIPNLEKKIQKAKNEYDDEVSKVTVKKEINETLLSNQVPEDANLDLSKTNKDLEDLGQKIENFAVTYDQDSKKIKDEIANGQNITQRTGDYSNMKDEEIVEVLEPDYEKNVNKIKNSGEPERKIWEDLVEENDKLIQNIDSKIGELEAKIEGDPNNTDVQKWKDDLETLKEIKDQKLAENDKIKADMQAYDNTADNNEVKIVNSIKDLNPDYNSNKSDIENDANLNDKEKAEKLKTLDQNTLNDVNQQIKITEEKLAKEDNPAKKTELKNSLENLKTIQTDLENDIKVNEEILASNNGNNSNNEVVAVNSINDIDPNYNSTKSDIENDVNLNPTQRIEKLKELNQNTLNQVEKQIQITQNQLDDEADPERMNELNNSMDNLNAIKSNLESEIEANNTALASNNGENNGNNNNGNNNNGNNNGENNGNNNNGENNGNINNVNNANENVAVVSTVNDIDPDFNSKKSAIENDVNLNPVQRAEKLKELNQNALNQVNEKIQQTQNLLEEEEDPEKLNMLNKSMDNLSTMKTNLENEIQTNNAAIASNNGTNKNGNNNANLTPIISIGDLDVNYEDQIENIGNSELSNLEKAKEKNKIQENLLNKINTEIEATNAALENNPSDPKLNERKQNLEKIKNRIQQEINGNNEIIKQEEENNFNVADENVEKILNSNNQDDPNNAVIALVNNTNMDPNDPKNKIENTDPNTFKSEESKNKFEEIKSDMEDLKTLKAENDKLNEELNSADEKQAKKIQKAITKNEQKLNAQEVEVLEKIGPIKNSEINAGVKENNVLSKEIAEVGVNNNTEILKNSERKIAEAIVLQNEAKELREKAEKTKDKEEKKTLLDQALQKENQALNLLENNKTALNVAKKDATLNKQIVSAIVINNVPENRDERESVKQNKLANQYLNEADNLQNEAQILRDSAATTKKKYKEDLNKQADELENQANKKFQTGNQIKENAKLIEEKENQWLEAHADSLKDRELSPAIVNEIAQKEEFNTFKKNNDLAKDKTKQADAIAEEIAVLQKNSKRKIVEAVVNYQIADTSKTNNRAEAELKAKQAEMKAEADLKKIEELQKKEAELRAEAKDLRNNAYSAVEDLDSTTANNIIAAANKNIQPVQVEPVNLADADFKTPTKLNGQNVFRLTNGDSPYSANNPVPTAGVVEGLVFKVQVGAFSKPIPQNTFARFAPMSTETIRGNIKRYMVGYFASKNPAFQARDQIRGMGYSDAFVVAYLNGKRISMGEADQLLSSGQIPVIAENANQNNDSNTNLAENNGNNNANNQNNDAGNNNGNNQNNDAGNNNGNNQNNDAGNNNGNNQNNNAGNENGNNSAGNNSYNVAAGAANSTQVEQMNGLFFTVQIGVYNRPVSAATLKNITPLNSQKTESNQIRYSTGVFTSVGPAISRRDEIRGRGIPDAFVTAYYNGKRITVSEANKLIQENGNSILYTGGTAVNNNNVDIENNNNDGNNGNNLNNENNNGNNQNNLNVENNSNPTPDGIYFRVDVGTYGEDVPQQIAKFLFDKNYKIENETMIDGNINFYTNKIEKYDEAQKLKQKLVDEGLAKAFVRAYYKYDEITLGAAMKILSGEQVEIEPIRTDLDDPENVIPPIKKDSIVVNEENGPKQISPADYKKEAVYFRLYMGTYDGEVPQDKAKYFFDSNIKSEEDELGRTSFYKGNFSTFEEVDAAQKDLQQKGFEGSEVKAFYKFEEISVDLAKIILEYK
ncbi:MAG: hypothetical protein R2799_02510 [Crocinitomicaceae bacterium]